MSTTFQPRAPEQKALVTIDRVEQRTVNKKDGSQFTMFDIFVREQAEPFNTTKRDIAESAFSLVGQPAEMDFTVKVNGNFTNYWANNVLPGPQNPALMAQLAAQAAAQHPVLGQAVPTPAPAPSVLQPTQTAPIPQAQVSDWEIQKQYSIHRQTAAKVAAVLHQSTPGTTAEFWENVRALVHFFDTMEIPTSEALYEGAGDDVPFSPDSSGFSTFGEVA